MVKRKKRTSRVLASFDASTLIGLPVMVFGAVEEIDEGLPEGPAIAIPQLEELMASAAVARCQLAPRLSGREVRTLRGLLDMGQADLAGAIGGDIVVATISRWENDTKSANPAVEKLVRLLACERLKIQAAGVPYDAVALIGLVVTERDRKMAPLEFRRTRTRVGPSIEECWTTTALEAPLAKRAA
jgi:DNA-binding transcriptional regulator YiaG